MKYFKKRSGIPKFHLGQRVGKFIVLEMLGHTGINQRNNRIMYKSQFWYRCRCDCTMYENRSQQELSDIRRPQMCRICSSVLTEKNLLAKKEQA